MFPVVVPVLTGCGIEEWPDVFLMVPEIAGMVVVVWSIVVPELVVDGTIEQPVVCLIPEPVCCGSIGKPVVLSELNHGGAECLTEVHAV